MAMGLLECRWFEFRVLVVCWFRKVLFGLLVCILFILRLTFLPLAFCFFAFYFHCRLLLKFIRWPFVLPLLTFSRIFLGLLFIFLKIFLHLFVFIANLFLAPFMLLLQLFLHPFSFIFQHVSLLLVFLILLPP